MTAITMTPQAMAYQLTGGSGSRKYPASFMIERSSGWRFDPEKVVDLADEDDQRDTAGKSRDDWGGNEIDDASQPEDADGENDQSRHESGYPEAAHSLLIRDGNEHRRHGAGGAADLIGSAAEQSNEKSADDGGDESSGWRRTAGDPEGERKRQRDRRDGEPGDGVATGGDLVVPGELIPEDADECRSMRRRKGK